MLDPVEEDKVKNLHKKLHRSFKTLQECIPAMKTCAAKQENVLKELCMFCEQYRECQMATVEKLQLPPQLADVKPKLLHMIVEQINKQLNELRSIMLTYQKLFDKIHNCKMQTFQNLPQINYLTRPNLTFPTLAVMLEWLDDSEKELFHQLCIKNEFLDSVNFKDETLVQKCKTKWLEEDTKVIAKFEGRLAYLQEFLDET